MRVKGPPAASRNTVPTIAVPAIAGRGLVAFCGGSMPQKAYLSPNKGEKR